MSRTKKLDLIKSSYRLAALIILISININILSAQTGASTNTYEIGESYRGGIIFYVTPNGRHGLIAETQDQGKCSFYNAQDYISTSSNHSREGQKFTDWRLPSTNELNILYENISSIGGFKGILYWSNQNYGDDRAYALNLKFGTKKDWKKDNVFNIRAVRTIK
jgi:hypothetical protein